MLGRLVCSILIIISALFSLFGCAGVQVNPSPVCLECKDSLICEKFFGPNVLFGTIEMGIAALVINEPEGKDTLRRAYESLKEVFELEHLTYKSLAREVANRAFYLSKDYRIMLMVLSQRLGDIGGAEIPLSDCDRKFLIEHCDNVLMFVK